MATDRERARERAHAYLATAVPDFDARFTIVDDNTLDAGWCWVFFWDSKRALETGELADAIAGNAPIAVDKESGDVHVTGTAHPVEYYLEQLRPGSD